MIRFVGDIDGDAFTRVDYLAPEPSKQLRHDGDIFDIGDVGEC
jgi:hypothetical protein